MPDLQVGFTLAQLLSRGAALLDGRQIMILARRQTPLGRFVGNFPERRGVHNICSGTDNEV